LISSVVVPIVVAVVVLRLPLLAVFRGRGRVVAGRQPERDRQSEAGREEQDEHAGTAK
jgi:hypothetical protein